MVMKAKPVDGAYTCTRERDVATPPMGVERQVSRGGDLPEGGIVMIALPAETWEAVQTMGRELGRTAAEVLSAAVSQLRVELDRRKGGGDGA